VIKKGARDRTRRGLRQRGEERGQEKGVLQTDRADRTKKLRATETVGKETSTSSLKTEGGRRGTVGAFQGIAGVTLAAKKEVGGEGKARRLGRKHGEGGEGEKRKEKGRDLYGRDQPGLI